MKDDEVFGLLKVPDEVIIKELRVKLGIANATIDEGKLGVGWQVVSNETKSK